jgi:hypothetical protein
MDFYVSPVTLLFESSLISIASLTHKEQMLDQTLANKIENKVKVNKANKIKLKKD